MGGSEVVKILSTEALSLVRMGTGSFPTRQGGKCVSYWEHRTYFGMSLNPSLTKNLYFVGKIS